MGHQKRPAQARRAFVSCLLVGLTLAGCSPSELRSPADGVRHTGLAIREIDQRASAPVRPGNERAVLGGREMWLKPGVIVSGDMVDHAGATTEQDRPALLFVLTKEGRARLAAETRRNIGRPLAFLVDGRLVAAPVVSAPIDNGIVVLTGDFQSQTAARDLAEAIESAAGRR